MSQQITIHPTHYFYWQIKFQDGFVLSKFDAEGNELDFKKNIPANCWYEVDGNPAIDFTRNVYANYEAEHGRATEVSWIAFSKELKQKIAIKQPTMKIRILKTPVPFTKKIPEGYFPYVKSDIKLDVQVTRGFSPVSGKGEMVSIYLGYMPKYPDLPNGKIEQINLTVEEEK